MVVMVVGLEFDSIYFCTTLQAYLCLVVIDILSFIRFKKCINNLRIVINMVVIR